MGFGGRVGDRMFASKCGVISDMLVLDKGLTGRYLPLAITFISEELFSAFDGLVSRGRALAYGDRYTGNAPCLRRQSKQR
jgi:adenosylmethionine-8-amino-7-oxononanoate aminotransferase